MLSVPYYPVQESLPDNVDIRDFGEGRRGVAIRGNGSSEPTGITQRYALTQGETRSLRSTVLVRSDLVANANGYEGIGLDVKCLVRDGLSLMPLVTWTNAPFLSGDPSVLTTEQFPEWSVITRVIHIPHDVPVEFIDCTWAVKGHSGEAQIISLSLRNHYQRPYTTNVGGATWSSFDRQLIPAGDIGHQIYAEIRYLDAYAVKCPQNAEVHLSMETYIDFISYRDMVGNRIPFIPMFGLKMRRKDGGYDYFGYRIATGEGTDGSVFDSQVTELPVNERPVFFAKNAYTQFEPIIYMLVSGGRNDYSSRTYKHRGMNVIALINDTIADGAT